MQTRTPVMLRRTPVERPNADTCRLAALCPLLGPILAIMLIGAVSPEARIAVTLPAEVEDDAGGRLLLFVEPASPETASTDAVDVAGPEAGDVSVVARDVSGFGPERTVVIDAEQTAYPKGLAALASGTYRVQAVLDRNHDYAYGGRGPGDLVSNVVTVRLPLASAPSIRLDHVLPPETDQFNTARLPARAAEQIAASRPHLHDEHIASTVLTRFRHARQTIAAWVLTPPGYDPAARTAYPTVYTAGGFGTTHKLDGQQLSKSGT